MATEHHFEALLKWSGANMGPTTDYESYSRDYHVEMEGKPVLMGSAATPFRGNGSLHNPEDLLLASVAACHMLSYFAVCARSGVVVVSYEDRATATMRFSEGKMRIVEATLRPKVHVLPGTDMEKAVQLHGRANAECFIASSVNFPIYHKPEVV